MFDLVWNQDDAVCSRAAKLGYKGLRVIGLSKESVAKGLKLLPATHLPKHGPFPIAQSSDNDRKLVEGGKIRLLYGAELYHEHDKLHFRSSNLDQVICPLLRKKQVAICFDFSLILKSKGITRSMYLGRMQQNVGLCRKYKVPMAIASFAKNQYELRSPHDLMSFGIVIGMHPSEVKRALVQLDNNANGENL